ncbi:MULTISPECIES: hypothetical protein [Nocardia]|uniref:hypothetical protein n=1 Tax=Nocardia TaxID=1817 RepID=UPI00130078A8|nr:MULTISPECIES: hypothetical protein [Nocardia]
MHRLSTRARRVLRALRDAVSASRPTQVRVRVYLNTDPTALLTGYRPDAPMTLAYTYPLPVDTDADVVLLERVFATFNDHPEHDDDQTHTDTWYAKGAGPARSAVPVGRRPRRTRRPPLHLPIPRMDARPHPTGLTDPTGRTHSP